MRLTRFMSYLMLLALIVSSLGMGFATTTQAAPSSTTTLVATDNGATHNVHTPQSNPLQRGPLNAPPKGEASIVLRPVGEYPVPEGGASEIVAFDPTSKLLFFTNSEEKNIGVVDISDPAAPQFVKTITELRGGEEPTSVTVHNGIMAIAVPADPVQGTGEVLFLTIQSLPDQPAKVDVAAVVNVGALPDMVTFTPDGKYVLVANEGEPGETEDEDPDYDNNDPEGSVSIIEVPADVSTLIQDNVTTVSFTDFNQGGTRKLSDTVRIFPASNSIAQDLEPEYIAVSKDSSTAYVTLQENNAVAVIDIATANVKQIAPLGFKHHTALSTYTFTNLPDLGTTAASETIKLGGFSGLDFEGIDASTGNYKFITHPDRGPNAEPIDTNGDGTKERPFPLPDYQAQLVRFELNPSTNIVSITQQITLTQSDGITPITGRPNLAGPDKQGMAYADEIPIDLSGNVLDYDPLGADMEGVVIDSNGHFWMVDEYRPAIYHFDATGKLIARFVPEDSDASTGTGSLPAVYAQRRANRGFEAVALDGTTLYAFIQSPIDNPDVANDANSKASRNNRILAFDTTTGKPTGEYLYVIEGKGSDKIGDAVALGNGEFLVIERDSATDMKANKKVFKISLKGATNLSELDASIVGPGGTLEGLDKDGLKDADITPVSKEVYVDLAKQGYYFTDKAEGLALLDDGRIAVLNDNDFCLKGSFNQDTGKLDMLDSCPIVLGIIDPDMQHNGLDASDKDDSINIQPWPVWGMYMPDSIAAFTTTNKTYFATANEGDARDEDVRIADLEEDAGLTLDPDAFPNAADLLDKENLGRLQVSSINGDTDGDGDLDQLYSYGARSFSIWEADAEGNVSQVYDSGDDFEQITAKAFPHFFNDEGIVECEDGELDSIEGRSDNKGPEPEALTTGIVDGKTYAFIGLERIGGIMVYDVTDPANPTFVQYYNHRTESANAFAPEGIIFIPNNKSPGDYPLLVVANEGDGGKYAGLTVYEVRDTVSIADIQGPYHFSPLYGSTVTGVQGVVTGVSGNGFFMQDANPDTNPHTSDGIFVYLGSDAETEVSVGDNVSVSGTVDEYFPGGSAQPSITQITKPTVTVNSSGATLPDPIVIGEGGRAIPDTQFGDTCNGMFNPDKYSLDFYESMEGMRVQVNDAVVVGGTSYDDVAVLADGGANASGQNTLYGGITIHDDFNPERIIIDSIDGDIVPDAPTVNVGDAFEGSIVGVINYDKYVGYKVSFTEELPDVDSGDLEPEMTSLAGTCDLHVATYNVYNLDPSDSDERFAALADHIITNLGAPDIIGMQEIQDNTGEKDDGIVDADQTYQKLIGTITEQGGPTYDYRQINPENNIDGGAPGSNIRVGFLYRTDRAGLTFVDRGEEGKCSATDAITVTDTTNGLSCSPGRIDPTNEAFEESRKPIVGEFTYNGETIYVVVAHFNSKSDDEPLFSSNQPPKLKSEKQRVAIAQVVNDFVDSILAVNANANIVVLGDLNDFEFSTAISDTLAADVLHNLMTDIPEADRYTYVYQGNSQVLDHILVSNNLKDKAEAEVVHLNADYGYFNDRASDHDPVVARITLPTSNYSMRILHTNDTHAHLEPDGGLGGIAPRKTLVDQLRVQSEALGQALLLLDAGDVFQGTLYFNQYEGLADLYFYNQLGYDAMAVGNHEFDKGPEALANFINGGTIVNPSMTVEGAKFPLLSANIDVSAEPLLAGKVKPWVTIERNGENIGIFGLTAEDTDILSSPGDNVIFMDPVQAAKQAVAELKAAGVNKIIALTHVGFNVDKEIAAQVDDIDIIVGGHSHTKLGTHPGATEPYPTMVTSPNGSETMIVANWEWGKYLGDIRVDFDANGVAACWEGQPRPVDGIITPDPAFQAKLDEFAAPLEEMKQEVVGTTSIALDGERTNVRAKETNLSNLICDALLQRTRTDGVQIALTNGGGIRASIDEGDVTVGEVITVLPFGNTVTLVTLTGSQVKQALENGVSQAENGAGRFPQVAGMRFAWDGTKPAGSRIVSIEIEVAPGTYRPIHMDKTYRLVTNNYIMGGGDGYSVLTEGTNAYDTGLLMADVVQEYIAAHSPVTADDIPMGRIYENALPAPDSTLPNGVAAGDVTQTSAVLWARTLAIGEVTFAYSTNKDMSDAQSETTNVTDITIPAKVEIDGLTAGTTYYYRVTDAAGTSADGTFTTPAAKGSKMGLRFGVTGDWQEPPAYPSLSNVPTRTLDFFVQHSDNIYADIWTPAVPISQTRTLQDFRAKYDEVLLTAAGMNTMRDLRASTSILATIDDHEVTDNFAGGSPASQGTLTRPGVFPNDPNTLTNDTQIYEDAMQALHDYTPLREETYEDTGDDARMDGEVKLYRHQNYGDDAAVFITDPRSFRDIQLQDLGTSEVTDTAKVGAFLAQAFNPERTMLGKRQLQMLKDDLLQSQQDGVTWKFVFISEPVQNFGPILAADRFEGYAAERTELLKYIDDNGIENVVFVTADFHGTVINNLNYQTLDGTELKSSPVCGSFEVMVGPAAFHSGLFGTNAVNLAAAAGMVTSEQLAFYNAQDMTGKDDFLTTVLNGQLQMSGYGNNLIGLEDSDIDATLKQGSWVASHKYGWTEFEIDEETQKLLVTTYGIEPYSYEEFQADPANITGRKPAIINQVEVNPTACGAQPQPAGTSVTILHTNDFHGRVDEYNTNGSFCQEGDEECIGGSARIATKVQEIRESTDNVLVLDAGDQFLGTLYYSQFKADIVAKMMNAIGYDVMAVGNHEFDDGPGMLLDLIDQAKFDVVGTNINTTNVPTLTGKIKPSTVVTVDGQLVGIVGLTTPETANISSPGDVTFDDEVSSAQAAVDALTAQGVDKVIALTHMGYTEDQALASQVSGIDVIIGGHSHTFLYTPTLPITFTNPQYPAYPPITPKGEYPTVVDGKDGKPVLIAAAYQWGTFLGKLDVTFDDNGIVTHYGGNPIYMGQDVEKDADVEALLAPYRQQVLELMNTKVGEITEDAVIEKDGDRICRLGECLMGNLVADAMLWKMNQDGDVAYQIAIQNGGGLRAPIDKPDVTQGEVLETLPFGNAIATMKLKGQHIWDALENGVSRYEDQSGRFPQVSGMRFVWDPNAEAGSRIVSVEVCTDITSYHPYTCAGYEALDLNATYHVVTNDYMRQGGDGYSVFANDAIDPYDYNAALDVALSEFIMEYSPVTPAMQGRITEKGGAPVGGNTIKPEEGGTVESTDMVGGKPQFAAEFPANALPEDADGVTVAIEDPDQDLNANLDDNETPVSGFRLTVTNSNGDPIVTTIEPITVTIRYGDDITDTTMLGVDYWDDTNGQWSPMTQCTSATDINCYVVDSDEQAVLVRTDQITNYRVTRGSSDTTPTDNRYVYLPLITRTSSTQ